MSGQDGDRERERDGDDDDSEADPQRMIKDLQRLLKYSSFG